MSFDSSPPRPVVHELPADHGDPAHAVPGPAAKPAADDEPEAAPPRYRSYVPLDGETWDSIAAEQLGNKAMAAALRKANPLRSGGPIEAGREIRIPIDPQNIQGRGPTAVQPEPEPSEERVAPPPASLQIREYTVQDQDTLGDISKRFYGTTRHWKLIFEHNKERLDLESETAIRAGQVLQIPALPGDQQG